MKLFFVILGVFCTANLNAAIYGYDQWVPVEIKNYISQIQAQSRSVAKPECEPMYLPMIQDGVLDIRYALGYFDDSTGMKVQYGGINYGYSPSLDIAIFEALRHELTAPCKFKSIRLCGFSQSGERRAGKLVFEKTVSIHEQEVRVRLTMTQGSASEVYADNLKRLVNFQQHLINQSEENFFGGLQEADVVFYNGHSRNGGGPDFRPPVLNKKNKTDYAGYYQVEKPGITRAVASLSQNPNPGFILGLFSCFSRSHFQKMIVNQNRDQRMILSADDINYFDSLKASIGYMEGILRGQCGEGLAKTAKQGSAIRRGFQQYNMQ